MSCRGSLVAMVTARCGKKSGQDRHAAEGSQSTNRNEPDPGCRGNGGLWHELSPGDSSTNHHGALLAQLVSTTRESTSLQFRGRKLRAVPVGATPCIHLSPGDSSTDGHRRLLHDLAAHSDQPLRRRSRSRSMCCRATSGGTTLRGGSGGASRAGAGGGADPCLAHALNSPRMARWMMPNR